MCIGATTGFAYEMELLWVLLSTILGITEKGQEDLGVRFGLRGNAWQLPRLPLSLFLR